MTTSASRSPGGKRVTATARRSVRNSRPRPARVWTSPDTGKNAGHGEQHGGGHRGRGDVGPLHVHELVGEHAFEAHRDRGPRAGPRSRRAPPPRSCDRAPRPGGVHSSMTRMSGGSTPMVAHNPSTRFSARASSSSVPGPRAEGVQRRSRWRRATPSTTPPAPRPRRPRHPRCRARRRRSRAATTTKTTIPGTSGDRAGRADGCDGTRRCHPSCRAESGTTTGSVSTTDHRAAGTGPVAPRALSGLSHRGPPAAAVASAPGWHRRALPPPERFPTSAAPAAAALGPPPSARSASTAAPADHRADARFDPPPTRTRAPARPAAAPAVLPALRPPPGPARSGGRAVAGRPEAGRPDSERPGPDEEPDEGGVSAMGTRSVRPRRAPPGARASVGAARLGVTDTLVDGST